MTTNRDLFADLLPPAPIASSRVEPEPDENYTAPAAHKHAWYPDVHVWTGETLERLVWRCHNCPELRGRA